MVAIAWLPVLIIPLVTHPSTPVADGLDAIDYTVWALFVVEYLVKLYLAPSRRRLVRTHLLDLLVILIPFLRPLRIARVLRLLRLVRVAAVLARALGRARSILTHKGLNFVLLAVILIVFAGAAAELAFEAHEPASNIRDFGAAISWAVVTVTTVGYGDRFPVGAAGRGVAVVLMLVGIGLVGAVTAAVASYFVEQRQDDQTAELEVRLDRIEGMLSQLLAERNGAGAGNESRPQSAAHGAQGPG